MQTAIVVFTRDLRLHDNPALHQACQRARQVVPLFVQDPAIPAPPNRARFLAESLADLRHQLRQRQADLIFRHGDPAAEIITLASETRADAVYLADDVSRYATRRRPNRIMNPLRQAQRFDPAGDYVRRYVPELAALPPARIHTPDGPYWPGP